jgi:Cro/C1-type HTH DNA-binding domain
LPRVRPETARQHREETSRQHREYVRRIMKLKEIGLTRLATSAKVSASTLSRLLKEGSTTTLRADTLSKLETFSGISPFSVVDMPSAPRGLAEDAVPFDAESADPAVFAVIKALVGSSGDANSRTISSRALEGLGYLPGDIVIVDRDRKPVPGDVVCAQVSDPGRSESETVMRIYQPPVLLAATFDPQQRLLWVDDPRVKIEGVVLPHRLRPTAPAA